MAWQQKNGTPFTRQDNITLNKQVNRFNRKLRRIMKKYEQENNIMLPNLLSVRQIKEDIVYRRDLTNLYRSINRFMERGSEELTTLKSGIQMTKYQKHELELGMRRGKRNLTNQIKGMKEELDKLNIDYEFRDNQYVKFRFTNDEINQLERKRESLRNIETRDKKSLANLIKRIDLYSSQSRLHKKNVQYKENYLQALDKNFKYVEGLDTLKERLKQIDDDSFYGIISYDDIASDIKTIYKEREDIKAGNTNYTEDDLFERITRAWDKVL